MGSGAGNRNGPQPACSRLVLSQQAADIIMVASKRINHPQKAPHVHTDAIQRLNIFIKNTIIKLTITPHSDDDFDDGKLVGWGGVENGEQGIST